MEGPGTSSHAWPRSVYKPEEGETGTLTGRLCLLVAPPDVVDPDTQAPVSEPSLHRSVAEVAGGRAAESILVNPNVGKINYPSGSFRLLKSMHSAARLEHVQHVRSPSGQKPSRHPVKHTAVSVVAVQSTAAMRTLTNHTH